MKKSVSMLLAALMLTGALAGCGSSASTSDSQAADGADGGVFCGKMLLTQSIFCAQMIEMLVAS